MGKHSKPRRSWAPYVTAGIALEAVAVFGFAYATDSHVSPPNLLAATIFVDGTKSVTGSEEGVPFLRMADSFQGAYRPTGIRQGFHRVPAQPGTDNGSWVTRRTTSPRADATTKIVAAR